MQRENIPYELCIGVRKGIWTVNAQAHSVAPISPWIKGLKGCKKKKWDGNSQVLDEICQEWDEVSASIVDLLDFSAAFDHGILLNQFWELDVGGTVLCWFFFLWADSSCCQWERDPVYSPYFVECLIAQSFLLSCLTCTCRWVAIWRFGWLIPWIPFPSVWKLWGPIWGTAGFDSIQTRLEWRWVFGFSGAGRLLSLILDGTALPQKHPVCNLGILLDSWLLLKE